MSNDFPLRVLVVHADHKRECDLSDSIAQRSDYEGIAANLPCNPAVLDENWYKELRQRTYEHRCHIVLIDRSCLGKNPDWETLRKKLAPAQGVLYVGDSIRTQRALHAFLDGVWFVPPLRSTSSVPPFGQSIDRAMRRSRLRIGGRVPLAKAAETIGVALDEIEELLAHLFPNAVQVDIEPLVRDTSYQSIARGKSALLTVSVDQGVEDVLKLGPCDRISTEADNYRRFVRSRLIGMRHVALASDKTLWNVGGLVYSLIGAGEDLPIPLSRYLLSNAWSADGVQKLLQELFHSWSRHYSGHFESSRTTDEPLIDQYDKVWSQKLRRKLEDLQSNLPVLPNEFDFLPHPVRWIAQHHHRSAVRLMRTAVTHGDLHTENVLVDQDGHCWLLDFERTGWGPILQDFVELETDIITRLTETPEGLRHFFQLCVLLTEPESPSKVLGTYLHKYPLLPAPIQDATEVIARLRMLAVDHTKYGDSRERLWGMLLNAIYVMSLTSDPERLSRALILGGVICQRLDGWDNYKEPPSWPPREWARLLSSPVEIASTRDTQPTETSVLKLQLTDLRNSQSEFKVAVLDDPNKQPSANSQLPFQGDGLTAVMKLLEPGGYQPDKFSPAQVAALEQLGLLDNNRLVHDWCDRIGDHLFKALLPAKGGVCREFENVFHTHRQGGELQLIFDKDATDLACQPWEMIHDGFPEESRTPIDVVRYIATGRSAQTLEVPQAPCQILYVTARPNGYARPAHDRGAIKSSVVSSASPGRFKFNELGNRTHQALKQRLLDTSAPVHVLHFDGHGTFTRLCPTCGTPNHPHALICGGDHPDHDGKKCDMSLVNTPARGYLLFEAATGAVEFIDTTKFLEGIQRSEVRLVVLSSCHSARVRGADLLLAGVGPGLILAGVPAVVAMQFSISDQDAVKFNQEFYKALAQGDSLPNAVYRARTVLDEPARWSPVLYMRSRDNQIYLCPQK